jgi:signal transduction histidine kinase/sugar lactone lactonase YvrE
MIAYDSANNFFWTMDQTTLVRKSWDGTKYKDESVMEDVGITQMIFDHEGNTWMGTYGNGLFKYFIRDFERWDLDIKAVKSIKMDRSGAIWMGSNNNGLSRLSKGKVKTYQVGYTTDNSVPDIDVSPNGEVWVASMGGLGHYDDKHDRFVWYTREDGLSSQYITDVDFDEKGGVWFGTGGAGLNYFDGKKFTSFPTEGQAISAIKYFPKRKTLYFETEQGLNALHDGKIDTVSIPAFLNTSIVSINIYKNSLLLLGTTGAGIAIFNPESGVSKIFTLKDGLISNFIYFVAADDDNYIWVGTEVGISRLKLNDQLEIIENLPFGYDNGLTGIETNQNAFYFNKKEKYFGLVDGVYQFNNRMENPALSNKLHISNVEVFFGEFSATQFADSVYGFFKIPYQPRLPFDKNHITFHFSRVNKSYPKSVKYKYTLENFETTWSQASAVSQATYSNLPPGNYVFKVMATNNSGSWDTVPLEYTFIVSAPFYQTAAFRVFVILLVVGLIVLLSMIRVRHRIRKVMEVAQIRQEEQDKLRKEIARDFHDEMGNQLTRIINYVSLMKLSKNGKAVELYDKVEDSAKYLYSGTRDFIWSIDPLNDELSKLFLHIRDFGEKLFNEKEIQFRAYNEVKDIVKIPYGFSREANLIFKEAMTNAFNHSQAKNVSFILQQKEGIYEMKLEDDGIGFDTTREKVNGIRNMRTRAERIKSKLTIERREQGIEVKLILPKINIENTWPILSKKES